MAKSYEVKLARLQQLAVKELTLNELYKTKMGYLGWIGVLILAAAFIYTNISFWIAFNGKMPWVKFLGFNGTTFTIAGAIWTALGVQLKHTQYVALLTLARDKTPKEAITGIVHSLYNASRFATTGASFIIIGGCALLGSFYA